MNRGNASLMAFATGVSGVVLWCWRFAVYLPANVSVNCSDFPIKACVSVSVATSGERPNQTFICFVLQGDIDDEIEWRPVFRELSLEGWTPPKPEIVGSAKASHSTILGARVSVATLNRACFKSVSHFDPPRSFWLKPAE